MTGTEALPTEIQKYRSKNMFLGKMKNSVLTTEPLGYPGGKVKKAAKCRILKLRRKVEFSS